MDHWLNPSTTKEIYNYYSWDELLIIDNVSDTFWLRVYEYFCKDAEFKWMIQDHQKSVNIKYPSYKTLFLAFINSRCSPPKILSKNRGFALLYIKKYPHSAYWVDTELRCSNKQILYEMIKYDVDVLKSANPKLLADKEFMLNSVKLNWRALQYMDDSLRMNAEFLLAAAQYIKPPNKSKPSGNICAPRYAQKGHIGMNFSDLEDVPDLVD